jgi:predicted small secreted protein
MRPPLSAFIAIAMLALLSACNTTAGAGQDISATGKAIERSAERNK